jgi:hypothetical protein
MAVVMSMRWSGVTKEQYDEVRRRVDFEGDRPSGGNLHIASFDDDALYVTDIWDSPEDFQRFVDTRLMPAVQELGLPGEPEVTFRQAHLIYAPAYE